MIISSYKNNYQKTYSGIAFMEQNTDYPIFHGHDFWEFVIITDGEYINEEANGANRPMKVHEACLLGPSNYHRLRSTTPKHGHLNIVISEPIFVKICSSLSDGLVDLFKERGPIYLSVSSSRMSAFRSYISELTCMEESQNSEIVAHLLAFNAIEAASKEATAFKKQAMPEWFKKLLVECNSPKNLKWKSADVTKYCNYSQAHINRLFKKYMNMSIVDYLVGIKMDNAAFFLTTTNMTLSEIVDKLGYKSLGYFNLVFKNTFNMTPHRYKVSANSGY